MTMPATNGPQAFPREGIYPAGWAASHPVLPLPEPEPEAEPAEPVQDEPEAEVKPEPAREPAPEPAADGEFARAYLAKG